MSDAATNDRQYGDTIHWGLLGPEHLMQVRRTRTLGLGAAVRALNERAVPGLGGMWFAKQLLITTLGVLLADHLRESKVGIRPVRVANAVEALACWSGYSRNQWTRDNRLRGRLKLPRVEPTFSELSKPHYYVSQPMRMAMAEPLIDLGFVVAKSQRFNSFTCGPLGAVLVDVATAGHKPGNHATVLGFLQKYAAGPGQRIPVTVSLIEAIAPQVQLSQEARNFIRVHLCRGSGSDPNADRRKRALAWVKRLGNTPDVQSDWERKPDELDPCHWRDLHLGANFFAARGAAIDLLDTIERVLADMASRQLTVKDASENSLISAGIAALQKKAHAFLSQPGHEDVDPSALQFCTAIQSNNLVDVISNLVQRDDRVLRLERDRIVPGGAFMAGVSSAHQDDREDDEGAELTNQLPVPSGISGRIRNLYLLEQDLQGNLDTVLSVADGN